MTSPVTSSTTTPSSSSSTTNALSGGTMGKDQFIKLLVAQLQHQDPLNPMDSSQMAAQLAQFSSVEQLMNINTTLTGQASGTTSMLDALDRNAALGMIGRSVTAVSDQISVSGHAATNIQTQVPAAGTQVRVLIVDASGNTVGTADYGVLAGGRQTLDLSGALKNVPNGSYTVKVQAIDTAGAATALSPIQNFKIDGLTFGTNGAVLTSGNRTVPLGNVIGVASN
jgi:flagellar basal-body rod modification protein FlgD